MATTTNYSWTTPDDTDLVKDGAAAIRTLGSSADTTVKNLNPGTTAGDVDYYTSSTAKARIGIGTAGQVLTVNSGATAPEWAAPASGPDSLQYAAGKNKIINGDFRINQRGFTSTTSGGTFGFDRFLLTESDGTSTYSAQTFTPGSAPVSGYEAINFVRLESTGQTATSAQTRLRQFIEDVRTFAGETVTVSFWAKASTGTPDVAVNLNQIFGSGGSSTVLGIGQKFAITTSWVRYSKTFTVASISGKTIGTGSSLNLNLWTSAGSDSNTQTDSIGIQSETIDFWGVQVEAGSVATAFQTATGTLAGELQACQRYYLLYASGNDKALGAGTMYQNGYLMFGIAFPTPMRTAPTLVAASGTSYYKAFSNGAGDLFNSVSINWAHENAAGFTNTTEIASTAGDGAFVITGNASASIALNAEL